MIIAAHRSAFARVHGTDAWQPVADELAHYADVLTAQGLDWSILYLDAPEESGASGQAAGIGDAAAAAALIRLEAQRLAAPEAVLLIGGHDVLPLFSLPARRPTLDADTDQTILSDNPYGCLSDDPDTYVVPDLAVGRLAIGATDPVDSLIAQIRSARLRRQAAGAAAASGRLVMTEQAWIDATQAVVAALPAGGEDEYQSPYAAITRFDRLQRALLFFNLHGAPTSAAWFGTDPFGTAQPALSPPVITQGTLDGPIAFACNCYGANLTVGSATESIALTLMAQGAACVIGATGYSFGALDFRFQYSEELAFRFFRDLQVEPRAGMALASARRGYATESAGNHPNLAYKTALQFVFLGDPLL